MYMVKLRFYLYNSGLANNGPVSSCALFPSEEEAEAFRLESVCLLSYLENQYHRSLGREAISYPPEMEDYWTEKHRVLIESHLSRDGRLTRVGPVEGGVPIPNVELLQETIAAYGKDPGSVDLVGVCEEVGKDLGNMLSRSREPWPE